MAFKTKKIRLNILLAAASTSAILAGLPAESFAAAAPAPIDLFSSIRAHGGRGLRPVVRPTAPVVDLRPQLAQLNADHASNQRRLPVVTLTIRSLQSEVRDLRTFDELGELADKVSELESAINDLARIELEIANYSREKADLEARIAATPPPPDDSALSASARAATARGDARAAAAAEAEARRLAAIRVAPVTSATVIPTGTATVASTTVIPTGTAPVAPADPISRITSRRGGIAGYGDDSDDLDGDDSDDDDDDGSSTTTATAAPLTSSPVRSTSTPTTSTASASTGSSSTPVRSVSTGEMTDVQRRLAALAARSEDASRAAGEAEEARSRAALAARRAAERRDIDTTTSVGSAGRRAVRGNLEGIFSARSNPTTSSNSGSRGSTSRVVVVVNPFSSMSTTDLLSSATGFYTQLRDLRQREQNLQIRLAEFRATQASTETQQDEIPEPPPIDEPIPTPPPIDEPTGASTASASADWREVARQNRNRNAASGRSAAISGPASSTATPPQAGVSSDSMQGSARFRALQQARLAEEAREAEQERIAAEARRVVEEARRAAEAAARAEENARRAASGSTTSTGTSSTTISRTVPDVSVDEFASLNQNEITTRFSELSIEQKATLCNNLSEALEIAQLNISILEMELGESGVNYEQNVTWGSPSSRSYAPDVYFLVPNYDNAQYSETDQLVNDILDADISEEERQELLDAVLVNNVTQDVMKNPNTVNNVIEILEDGMVQLSQVEGAYDDHDSQDFNNEIKAGAYLAGQQTLTGAEVAKEQQKAAEQGAHVGTNQHQLEMMSNFTEFRTLVTSGVTGLSSGDSGLSAGDDDFSVSKGLWISGIYGTGKQSAYVNRAGYNSKTTGAVIGGDVGIGENEANLIGAAYANVNSNFKIKQVRKGDKTEVKSHVYSLYGQVEALKNVLLQGSASVINSKITNKSLKLVGANNYKLAKGKFDSLGYSFNGSLSYVYKLDSVILMPNIGVKYGKTLDEAYNETGSGVYNLSVSSKSSKTLSTVAGIKAILPQNISEDTYIAPMVHASVERILQDKERTAKVKLQWADQSFTNDIQTGSRDKMGYNAGVGLVAKHKNIEVQATYNYHNKKRYSSHQGALKLEVKF